jgi:elongation factor P--(R)-beta-lysine ligase
MPSALQLTNARLRARLLKSLRNSFETLRFWEVETPILIRTPGLEPHIDPFHVPFHPQMGVGQRRELFLHTSPEYAMKRLLAAGSGSIFQICKTFRNGEVSATHNPEFSMLEFYRAHADYHALMDDVEVLLEGAERDLALSDTPYFQRRPFERLTVREAMLRYANIDWVACADGASLKAAATAQGIATFDSTSFEDVFFHILLSAVEPKLGVERPTFLCEYPASMASLARLKPDNVLVAERVELYARGLELGNGFSELTDEKIQRERLLEEQALREKLGRPAFALDEAFLRALPNMPPAAGIALGLDRILMTLTSSETLNDVLLFPAKDFV